MRRLTALALLVSALFITPLYGEETTPADLLPLDLPPPVASPAPAPTPFIPTVAGDITLRRWASRRASS